jgi:hypothetical protein
VRAKKIKRKKVAKELNVNNSEFRMI